ncbi:uncharacterized protein Dana_GF13224 [Drosophila ananassae]|uniref:Uncharacterized protein n=1 Tax=Drosophila ananassae TaxID=7217 RepID=B3MIC2_DROAN|nr:uncharacterized protein LOC6496067 [Drosophila ananassae]EDV36970.1 uncharacterized protein Dana_GF13224 [Drosophila ananassae]
MVDRGKNLVLPVGPCLAEATETQTSFGPPKIKKILPTRANRMEQFLWQEFFNEYNRQASAQPEVGTDTTEYYDQFCKDIPPKDEELEEVLINKYPLYCTTAVTLWNHEGDPTMTFKRKYSITKPIHECTEKFAL